MRGSPEETETGGRKMGKLSQNWESTLQNLELTANLVRDVASERAIEWPWTSPEASELRYFLIDCGLVTYSFLLHGLRDSGESNCESRVATCLTVDRDYFCLRAQICLFVYLF